MTQFGDMRMGRPMHDIWNPWHGCRKCSEGCAHCYMFTMDRLRGLDGGVVRRNKNAFDYPLQRFRDGSFKVKPGELIRVCMNSDFLIEEADLWRAEVWNIIAQRPDVRFFILTKRPERFAACLPPDWGDGWDNVMLNVSCENQRRADERIPVLLATPAKHKGIMCAPLIGRVDVSRYLGVDKSERLGAERRETEARMTERRETEGDRTEAHGTGIESVERSYARTAAIPGSADNSTRVGRAGRKTAASTSALTVRGAGIEQVICGGENYEGARPCDYDWVKLLAAQCRAANTTFAFIETGSCFVKDGRRFRLRSKELQAQQAYKSGLCSLGRPIVWHLHDALGLPVPRDQWAVPRFRAKCRTCGSLMICNGCSNCGACPPEPLHTLEELCGRDVRTTVTAVWDTR